MYIHYMAKVCGLLTNTPIYGPNPKLLPQTWMDTSARISLHAVDFRNKKAQTCSSMTVTLCTKQGPWFVMVSVKDLQWPYQSLDLNPCEHLLDKEGC